MSDYGRETVVFFETDQPLCVRAWGDGVGSPPISPGGCTAVLGVSGSRKCFNTRFTCPVPASYSASALTLRFCRPQMGLEQYGNVIPSMIGSPSTTPAMINLAAMDKSSSALGIRESVSLTFTDHLHSDLLVDPYRLQRKTGAAASGSPPEMYDPYQQGTFWGKWIARNPYFSGYPCRIREGFVGDALEDMRVRHYIIDRIDGPSDGVVKLVAKDLFSKVEALKAQAPLASRGELSAGISAVAGSASLSPAGIGAADYPASGYVAIGDEIAAFTRSGDTLTLTQRGALHTDADEHDIEDLVQVVLEYTTELPHEIIYDLLVTYTAIPASAIDLAEWAALASDITALYTGRVAKPTAVLDLIGEICEQAGITIWPDVSTGMIRLAALRATAPSATVDDDTWIVEGSLTLKRRSEKRASEVWVHYGQKNPVKDLEDDRNYHSRVVVADLAAEGDDQYGTAAIRKVFSRWIPQFGGQFAEECGERILGMFRDVPTEASFSIHASRDSELDLAAPFTLRTADVQDETGAVLDVTYVPIEIERGENEINITAQGFTFSAGGNDVGGNDRNISIENDSMDLNLRTIHDSLFTAPVGGSPGETVTFTVLADVSIGSTSTSAAALRTGSWPAGVHLVLVNEGRIEGKGGAGGTGGEGTNTGNQDGASGEAGGGALLVEYALTIDNSAGEIWGGGGGGGGGAGAWTNLGGPIRTAGAGGGGGGAGNLGGAAGSGGFSGFFPGSAGSDGTDSAGGTNGGGGTNGTLLTAGAGGAAGGPGLNGSSGTAGTPNTGTPGTGGGAGAYIVGISSVTWIAMGDLRGGVV